MGRCRTAFLTWFVSGDGLVDYLLSRGYSGSLSKDGLPLYSQLATIIYLKK